jgi:dipeptidase
MRVGDGDGRYEEQWNLSGDRRVSIVLKDLNPRPQAVLFNRLIPVCIKKKCR